MRIALTVVATFAMIGGVTTLASAKPNRPKQAAFQLNSTSWEFAGKDGTRMSESIGPDGSYVVHSASKHVDHGQATMKDGKACFTSAMNHDGEECWTAQPVSIGRSFRSESDKGRKEMIKRVKYTPPKM